MLGEEGAIQSRLEHGMCMQGGHALESVHHELMGALAVMDIAGTVQDVEELPALSHGAEQVVVTARPLPFGIVADRGAFGMSACGHHRSVEVEGHTGEIARAPAPASPGSRTAAALGDIGGPQARQGATDGGHVG